MRRFRELHRGRHTLADEVSPSRRLLRWGVLVATLVLTLRLGLSGVAQPVEVVMTPLVPGATPPAATPRSAATPLEGHADDSGGVGSRLLGSQAAAQATIAAYATREAAYAVREATQATRIATLEAAVVEAQLTATALVLVAANTVLDPTRQTLTLQTNLEGMLSGDADTLAEARADVTELLARYPPGCRAGFMLISGNAPSIEEGVALAQRVEMLLREEAPAIVTEATAAELFALPNQLPFGQVGIDIFFYAGCQPTESRPPLPRPDDAHPRWSFYADPGRLTARICERFRSLARWSAQR